MQGFFVALWMEQRKILLIGGPINGQEFLIESNAAVFKVALPPPKVLVISEDISTPARIPEPEYVMYKQLPEDPCIFIYS